MSRPYDLFNQPKYHNTTRVSGDQLRQYQAKAEEQDTAVLVIMSTLKRATPSQVQALLPSSTLITSVRRSMTNLTKEGKLAKTTERRTGPYGRPEHLWQYVEP